MCITFVIRVLKVNFTVSKITYQNLFVYQKLLSLKAYGEKYKWIKKLNCFKRQTNQVWLDGNIIFWNLFSHDFFIFLSIFVFFLFIIVYFSFSFIHRMTKNFDAHRGINDQSPRIPFIPQTSVKVGTERFCCRLNFAGGRSSWLQPLSLQIALNRINVVTRVW